MCEYPLCGRTFSLIEKGSIASRGVQRTQAGRDDTLVVSPRRLAVVGASRRNKTIVEQPLRVAHAGALNYVYFQYSTEPRGEQHIRHAQVYKIQSENVRVA